jgi:hypothetical protein
MDILRYQTKKGFQAASLGEHPRGRMRLWILALLIAVWATMMPVSVATAAPAFPPEPPYEGCTDWYLQYMSPDEPQWAFTCTQTGDEYGIAWWRADEYYWNADSSQAILFATSYFEDGGWYWYANYYNCSSGCAYDA